MDPALIKMLLHGAMTAAQAGATSYMSAKNPYTKYNKKRIGELQSDDGLSAEDRALLARQTQQNVMDPLRKQSSESFSDYSRAAAAAGEGLGGGAQLANLRTQRDRALSENLIGAGGQATAQMLAADLNARAANRAELEARMAAEGQRKSDLQSANMQKLGSSMNIMGKAQGDVPELFSAAKMGGGPQTDYGGYTSYLTEGGAYTPQQAEDLANLRLRFGSEEEFRSAVQNDPELQKLLFSLVSGS
jgi:hypothetical protein